MGTTSVQDNNGITIFHAHCGEVCYRVFFCDRGIIASVLDHATSETAQRIDIAFLDPETTQVINKTC